MVRIIVTVSDTLITAAGLSVGASLAKEYIYKKNNSLKSNIFWFVDALLLLLCCFTRKIFWYNVVTLSNSAVRQANACLSSY